MGYPAFWCRRWDTFAPSAATSGGCASEWRLRARISPGGFSSSPHKAKRHPVGVPFSLASYDNYDTVSKGFTGFHFSAVWFHFALREMKPYQRA